MEPEEIAGYVIAYFNMPCENPSPKQYLSRSLFANALFYHGPDIPPPYQGLPQRKQEAIIEALMEAWWWLEREGLLVENPLVNQGVFFVSRRGRSLQTAEDLKALRHADLLPRKFLHPHLAPKVWGPYLRGDYDIAVFQAFKEVEVAVRHTGNFPATEPGFSVLLSEEPTMQGNHMRAMKVFEI